jgi:acetyltransferase-like isoleucine patch superfamily enzyme
MQVDKALQFGGFLGHGGYGKTVDYKHLQHLYKGEVADYNFKEEDYVVIGAGYPDLRKKIYDDLKKKNLKFYTLVGRHINIDQSCKIGEANIFVYPCELSENINIGDGNVFNCGIVLGHDAQIGNFNFFGPRSQVLGNVKIGDMNSIGAGSVILPKAKIGNNNKIAPLSAVYKGCRDNGYYLGNPALKVGDN